MQLPEWSAVLLPFLLAFVVTVAGLLGCTAWIRGRLARSAAEELARVLHEFRSEVASAKASTDSPPSPSPPKDVSETKVPDPGPVTDFGSGQWRRDRGPAQRFSEVLPDGTADPDSANAEPLPTLISVPCLDANSEDDRNSAAESLGRRHAAIWEMARGGHSIEEITKATGQPIGEIEVILNLQRQIHPHESTG